MLPSADFVLHLYALASCIRLIWYGCVKLWDLAGFYDEYVLSWSVDAKVYQVPCLSPISTPSLSLFFFVSATIHSISWGGQGLRYRGWTGVEGDWRVWGNVMNSTRSPDCTLFINNRWGDSDNITIMMDMEPALMTILSELCGEMYVDKKPLMLSILSLSLHRGLLA